MREHRIPVMMSEAEVQAIDEYRFSNRIGTRSGAVRQLCSKAIHDESPIMNVTIDNGKPNRILEAQVRVISVEEAHLGVLELATDQGFLALSLNRNVAALLISELANFMAATEVDDAPPYPAKD